MRNDGIIWTRQLFGKHSSETKVNHVCLRIYHQRDMADMHLSFTLAGHTWLNSIEEVEYFWNMYFEIVLLKDGYTRCCICVCAKFSGLLDTSLIHKSFFRTEFFCMLSDIDKIYSEESFWQEEVREELQPGMGCDVSWWDGENFNG